MKRFVWLVFFVFLIFPPTIYAESSYVLPYPSFMPGNKLYTIRLISEEIEKWWHFGTLSKTKYYQSQTDRYLVEAKILFEYKQYLLAHQALKKSNEYFTQEVHFLNRAQLEGKDISSFLSKFKDQTQKHIEELEKMKMNVPEQFLWKPEKGRETFLMPQKDINAAIQIRKECL